MASALLLVATDDTGVRGVFEDNDTNVTVAESGAVAVRRLNDRSFDRVVVHAGIDESIDGVVRAIARTAATTPITVVDVGAGSGDASSAAVGELPTSVDRISVDTADEVLGRIEASRTQAELAAALDAHRQLSSLRDELSTELPEDRSARVTTALDRLVANGPFVGGYPIRRADGAFVLDPPGDGEWTANGGAVRRSLDEGEIVAADGRTGTCVVPIGSPPADHGLYLVASDDLRIDDATRDHLREIASVVGGQATGDVATDTVFDAETLVGMLAHELRNPVELGRGCLELVDDDPDPEDVRAAMDAFDRIERVVGSIRSLVEMDGPGGVKEQLFEDAVRDAWAAIDAESATLEVESSRPIRADPELLERLLSNLFRNAVEHVGPDVTVRCGVTKKGVYVEDDGPGIPEGERDRVLEPGVSDGGTGLGLAIVDRIVTLHGFELSISEGTDGGARFDVIGL